jgi:hypothetical protein
MDPQEIKDIIIRELPSILKNDLQMREFVLSLTEGRFADKEQTESRFDRMLDELRRDREKETERWNQAAQERAEERRQDAEKWAENRKQWAENREQWAEQTRQWAENQKRWEANQGVINENLNSIKALERKHDSTIGALGARWGLHSEQSFRNALKGILEDFFGVEVVNVLDFDSEGEVFGRPDQVELDIIIRNGLLIICEIKSSMSKSDMHIFERKARFYEARHNRKATRLMVISPMVDAKAKVLAEQLGIMVYSYPEDIDPATFS